MSKEKKSRHCQIRKWDMRTRGEEEGIIMINEFLITFYCYISSIVARFNQRIDDSKRVGDRNHCGKSTVRKVWSPKSKSLIHIKREPHEKPMSHTHSLSLSF